MSMSKRLFCLSYFGFMVLGVLVFLHGSAVIADDKPVWEYHRSVTESFEARFPRKYKMRSFPLRVDNETILFQNEIVAVIDNDGDNPKNAKTYVITVDQTLGGTLSSKKVKALLKRDAMKYKKAASASGGKLVSVLDIDDSGFIGKEIYITYGEEDDEYRQGLRVRIWYTDVTRVEMIVSGPAKALYGFTAKSFFESLQLYDGNAKIDGKVGENWVSYPSDFGMYTIRAPEKGHEYVYAAPQFIKVNDGLERGRMIFVDPVLGYKAIYDFYGYKIRDDMDYESVTTLIYSEHVSKYAKTMRREDLKVDRDRTDKYGILTTRLVMRPLEKTPYIRAGVIQALFNDNGVLVLEFLGTPEVAESNLPKALFSQVLFHPEKAYDDYNGEDANSSMEDKEDKDEDADKGALLEDSMADDMPLSEEDKKLEQDILDADMDEAVEEMEKAATSEEDQGEAGPTEAPPSGIPADAMPKDMSSDEETPKVNFGSGD